MIRIDYKGRFGNNLFQYMAAMILADIYEQNIINPMNTKILCPPTNHNDSNSKFNVGLRIHDNNIFDVFTNPKINKYHLALDTFCQFDFIANLFYENRKYLMGQKDFYNNNDLFIHVRLDDILYGNNHMSFNYYDSIIKTINFTQGYISSDTENHSIIKMLISRYDLQLISLKPEDTIIFASHCKHKVLSMGTFSWWIGFLGCQDNVFCPNYETSPRWVGNIYTNKKWNYI